ncbi:palindromic element RPE1 domain-containing protein [Candidatus Rickettsia barbariae]
MIKLYIRLLRKHAYREEFVENTQHNRTAAYVEVRERMRAAN